jgi:hypothetical protein
MAVELVVTDHRIAVQPSLISSGTPPTSAGRSPTNQRNKSDDAGVNTSPIYRNPLPRALISVNSAIKISALAGV